MSEELLMRIQEMAARIEQLETALAECRDAMPEQEDKAIDALMVESIASPDAVPAYVKAVAVQIEREKAELRKDAEKLTPKQMEDFVRLLRNDTLEEAAVKCEDAVKDWFSYGGAVALEAGAKEIRSMKS